MAHRGALLSSIGVYAMKQPTRQSGAAHYSQRTPERVRRGVDAPGAKLGRGDIAAIRAAYETGVPAAVLAEEYGVSRITIWRHTRGLPRNT